MADFTVIETQEQLDKVIGERIKRAEAKAAEAAAEKYKDYEALQKQVAQLTEQAQKHTESKKASEAKIAELEAKIHTYETDSVKTRVALELGIPYQMASRLKGDDEKAIRADAESMAKLIGTTKPTAPLGSSEPNTKNSANSAWTSLSAALNNQ
jgi:hypothetical protein